MTIYKFKKKLYLECEQEEYMHEVRCEEFNSAQSLEKIMLKFKDRVISITT
jgi:hypothetical protein